MFPAELVSTSEEIAWNGSYWAVLFEGGAMPYRQRWDAIEDQLLVLDVPSIVRMREGNLATKRGKNRTNDDEHAKNHDRICRGKEK